MRLSRCTSAERPHSLGGVWSSVSRTLDATRDNGAPPESVPSTISKFHPPASASRASHAREKRLRFHGRTFFPRRRRTGAEGAPCLLTGGSLRLEMMVAQAVPKERGPRLWLGLTRGRGPHSGVLPFVRHRLRAARPSKLKRGAPPIKKQLPQGPHAARPDAPSAQPADPLPAESVAIYRHVGEDRTVFLTNRPDGDGGISFRALQRRAADACGVGPDGVRGSRNGMPGNMGSNPGWSQRSSRSNRDSTPGRLLRPGPAGSCSLCPARSGIWGARCVQSR